VTRSAYTLDLHTKRPVAQLLLHAQANFACIFGLETALTPASHRFMSPLAHALNKKFA
jgi:hypothetical protein